ncbi:hypothetical protein [Prevotella sp.]|uniref:hypothetical protein n=1 Tax=Prevotella sp. TaxID=59823 RepID=UPI0027E344CB|nr:hypothetical protein [Prevotella sp.]
MPEVIAKDFNNRYGTNNIEQVYTGTDFYRHTGQQETYVYCKDKAGNELLVVYVDNVWNRSVLTLSDINKLPDNVRQIFYKELPKSVKYEFWKIKEITQACISGKYYELCYIVQDSSMTGNSLHTIVIDSEGMVLKSCEYELNDNAYVRPLPTDIDWISEHYRGATVLGYINDLGDDNYLIMHNGVLKSVLFDSNNLDAKWKETRYALPKGTTVPSRVLDTLHTKYPDFTYTEVFVVENPGGIFYLFIDGTRADRLGYYIEAN